MTRRRRILVLASLAVLAAAGFALYRHRRAEALDFTRPFDARPVREATFLKRGRALVFGGRRAMPVVYYYYLRHEGRYRLIGSADDLIGEVEIHSPEQALAYARITGRGGEMSSGWWELLAPGTNPEHYGGPLGHKEWEANRLSTPSVTRSGDQFVVRRWAYRTQLGRVKTVCQLAETVSRDGHLTRKVVAERDLVGVEIRVHGLM